MPEMFGLQATAGTLTGGALGTDAAPTQDPRYLNPPATPLTTPPASRLARARHRQPTEQQGQLYIFANGSATVTVWIFDETSASWRITASGLVLAAGAPVTTPSFADAFTFVQITAGGTATYMGVTFR